MKGRFWSAGPTLTLPNLSYTDPWQMHTQPLYNYHFLRCMLLNTGWGCSRDVCRARYKLALWCFQNLRELLLSLDRGWFLWVIRFLL